MRMSTPPSSLVGWFPCNMPQQRVARTNALLFSTWLPCGVRKGATITHNRMGRQRRRRAEGTCKAACVRGHREARGTSIRQHHHQVPHVRADLHNQSAEHCRQLGGSVHISTFQHAHDQITSTSSTRTRREQQHFAHRIDVYWKAATQERGPGGRAELVDVCRTRAHTQTRARARTHTQVVGQRVTNTLEGSAHGRGGRAWY